jgi:hypothetical protein
VKLLLITAIIFNLSFSGFADESLSLFVRNASEKDMNIRLIQKANQRTVYEETIPRNRTQKIDNLQKGAYILYYKLKGDKEWRVMNVLVLTSEKTYVLF